MKRTYHTVYAGPPIRDFGDQYLTVKEYARVMRCGERHVRRLVDEMAFAEFGIPFISIPCGRYRKVYIFSPSSMML